MRETEGGHRDAEQAADDGHDAGDVDHAGIEAGEDRHGAEKDDRAADEDHVAEDESAADEIDEAAGRVEVRAAAEHAAELDLEGQPDDVAERHDGAEQCREGEQPAGGDPHRPPAQIPDAQSCSGHPSPPAVDLALDQ